MVKTKKQQGGGIPKQVLLEGLKEYIKTGKDLYSLLNYVYTSKGKSFNLLKECLDKIRKHYNSTYYKLTFGRDYLAEFNNDSRHIIHYDIHTGKSYYLYIITEGESDRLHANSIKCVYKLFTIITLLIIQIPITEYYTVSGNTLKIINTMQNFTREFNSFNILRNLHNRNKTKSLSDLEYELMYYKYVIKSSIEFNKYTVKGKLLAKLCLDKILKKFIEYGIMLNKTSDNTITFYFGKSLDYEIYYDSNNLMENLYIIKYLINCVITNNCGNIEELFAHLNKFKFNKKNQTKKASSPHNKTKKRGLRPSRSAPPPPVFASAAAEAELNSFLNNENGPLELNNAERNLFAEFANTQNNENGSFELSNAERNILGEFANTPPVHITSKTRRSGKYRLSNTTQHASNA
jgi:hypothetical protein